MKSSNSVSLLSDHKSRSCFRSFFVTTSLICGIYFIGSAWLGNDNCRVYYLNNNSHKVSSTLNIESKVTREDDTRLKKCNEKCVPFGSEALPKGIVAETSNLEMQPLWGPVSMDKKSKSTRFLLAIAVGIKQKSFVHQILEKFLATNDFVVMLFHYDGFVNEWNEFKWSERVIHISATNQTKWWFAKRFLHPDIVAEYEYIFLWDEDLGVENFHPGRYMSIVREEGLEISQPALDASKSDVHHRITVRRNRSRVHRRYYNFRGRVRCDGNSTAPPCVGWVEMMAPVFSRAAWRCAWYIIQNDLIHAWGLDMQLGYCAQGDRTVKVGVVDEEYVVHLGLPTLGGVASASYNNKTIAELSNRSSNSKNLSDSESLASSIGGYSANNRSAVRLRSYAEMRIFRNRWDNAVKEDECWIDPFAQQKKIN